MPEDAAGARVVTEGQADALALRVAGAGVVTLLETPPPAISHSTHRIEARDQGGRDIGSIEYHHDGRDLIVDQVEVLRPYRRQGIATAMHDAMLVRHPECVLGPAELSADGEDFRRAYIVTRLDRCREALPAAG